MPSPPLADQGRAGGAGARAYMEDKHTVVSSFKPLGAGAVEDGIERSYFAVFDGAGWSCHHAVATRCAHIVLLLRVAVLLRCDHMCCRPQWRALRRGGCHQVTFVLLMRVYASAL